MTATIITAIDLDAQLESLGGYVIWSDADGWQEWAMYRPDPDTADLAYVQVSPSGRVAVRTTGDELVLGSELTDLTPARLQAAVEAAWKADA